MATDPVVLWLASSSAASVIAYGAATWLPAQHAAAVLVPLAIVLFCLSPHLASVCESVLLVQSLTCLLGSSAFKVLSLALRRGALARELAAGCSLWRFMGVAVLPVIPTNTALHTRADMASTPGGCTAAVMAKLQKSLIKLCAFAAMTLTGMWALYGHPTTSQQLTEGVTGAASDMALGLADSHNLSAAAPPPPKANLHAASLSDAVPASPAGTWAWVMPLLRPFLYYLSGIALWVEVDGMGDLVDALALALFGIQAAPHFRVPVMASTVAEYWGKRWNLTMSSMLKDLIFDPIVEGRLLPDAKHAARLGTAPQPSHKDSADHSKHSIAAAAVHAALEPSGPTDEAQPLDNPSHMGKADGTSTPVTRELSPSASAAGSLDTKGAAAGADGGTMATASSGGSSVRTSSSGSNGVPRSDSEGSMGASSGGEMGSTHPHGRSSRSGRPSSLRKALASTATFAVSGVWHELVFYQMSGGFSTYGYWTAFFVIQAPFILVETLVLKRLSKAGWREPKWLAMPRINLIIMMFLTLFWIPPLIRLHTDTCPGCTPAPDGSPALLSVFQRIMHQAHRDLQHMLQQAMTVTTVLSSTVLGGGAVQERLTKVVQDAGQLLGVSV